MSNAIVNDFNALAATFREYEAKKRADLAGTPERDPDEPTWDSVSRHSNNDPVGDGGESVFARHKAKFRTRLQHPGADVLAREKERVAIFTRQKHHRLGCNCDSCLPNYPTNRVTNTFGQAFEDRRVPLGPYAMSNHNAMTHDMLLIEAKPPHQWTVEEAQRYGRWRKLKADCERGYSVTRVRVKT